MAKKQNMKTIKCILLAGMAFFLGTRFVTAQDSINHQSKSHQHKHGDANKHMHSSSFDELVKRFESEERDEWQMPDEVVSYLGDLHGLTVFDIGSGTGYFSFRLAQAGATVICGDVDDRFLEYISQAKIEKGFSDDQILPKKLPFDSPFLQADEVDMVFTVNTYHHIENRPIYFSEVRAGLKNEGRLVIIDFFKKDTPVGPPVNMKLSVQEVIGELIEAGFTNFEVNKELLPYQYILIAK